MIMRDLLLEIGCEEIPARFIPKALEAIQAGAMELFKEKRIQHGEMAVFGTPRRLTLYVKGVGESQSDIEEKFRGPQRALAFDENGTPTKAAVGFAKGKKITPEELTIESVDGVDYVFALVKEKGEAVELILPALLENLIKGLVFPKSMYWHNPSVRFARPVRWIVCLLGDQPLTITFGNVTSGKNTRGHRFMGAPCLEIPSPSVYSQRLADSYVLIDPADRRKKILDGISQIEKQINGKVDVAPELLEENTFLVEYPIPFYGEFEREFLEIPEEVLITTMQKNQRYFPVRDTDGKLMPYFVGVSNNKARDMSVVRNGNERVLRARLYDAAFFWKEDQAKTLESRVSDLERVLYQEELGSVLAKSERVRKQAGILAQEMGETSLTTRVDRAAFLSKADLVTGMVYEFPEVQGVMGREYAKKAGEPDRVALALYEQYLPRFAGDNLPTDKVGAILGLADRLDTLVAIHKIGLIPTGSQDPYGLRRAVRCINELIWGLSLDFDIHKMIQSVAKDLDVDAATTEKVLDFVKQRTTVQLRERGYLHGMVSLAVQSQGARPYQAMKMLEVIGAVCEEDWFASLIIASTRVRNILAKSEGQGTHISAELFNKEAEKHLFKALNELTPQLSAAVEQFDWQKVNELLLTLSPHIDLFFAEVMVMDDDVRVRENRLALLRQCKQLFDIIGDFSLLKK